MLSDRGPVCPVLSVTLVHCGQTVGRIKMKLGVQVGLGPGHIALDGDPAPPPPKGQRGTAPIFGPYLLRPNGCMDQDVTWYPGRLDPGDFVLDGDPTPTPKNCFSSHVPCGQTAGCIKMVLGMKVGLNPGDFVLDGDSTPSPKGGGAPPQFSAHFYCGQTAGWIKMPLGMKVGLSPGDSLLDGDATPPPHKGVELPPQFSDHFFCG